MEFEKHTFKFKDKILNGILKINFKWNLIEILLKSY